MFTAPKSKSGISLTDWCNRTAENCADEWHSDQEYYREPYFLTPADAYVAQHLTDQGIHIDPWHIAEMFGSDLTEYPVWAWMLGQFKNAFDARVEFNGCPNVGSQP